MKRHVLLIFTFILAVCMAACSAPRGPQTGLEPEPPAKNTQAVSEQPGDVLITYNGPGTGEFFLSQGESRQVRSVLEGKDWDDGVPNCAADVLISFNGRLFYYHSDCGTFIDRENGRSIAAGETLRSTINEIFERYMTLGISHVSPPDQEYDWGIVLTLDDLTRSGAAIVCRQSGGNLTGELSTGSRFVLERYTESGWVPVETLPPQHVVAWTDEAWLVNMNGETRWAVDWSWLYGELPDGHYRIGKEFMDFHGSGRYDTMMVYAEFSFGEMLISE